MPIKEIFWNEILSIFVDAAPRSKICLKKLLPLILLFFNSIQTVWSTLFHIFTFSGGFVVGTAEIFEKAVLKNALFFLTSKFYNFSVTKLLIFSKFRLFSKFWFLGFQKYPQLPVKFHDFFIIHKYMYLASLFEL